MRITVLMKEKKDFILLSQYLFCMLWGGSVDIQLYSKYIFSSLPHRNVAFCIKTKQNKAKQNKPPLQGSPNISVASPSYRFLIDGLIRNWGKLARGSVFFMQKQHSMM